MGTRSRAKMMFDRLLSALLVVTLLTFAKAQDCDECSWGAVVHDALKARDLVVANVKASYESPSLETYVAVMDSVDDLISQLDALHKLDVRRREVDERFVRILIQQPSVPIVTRLFGFKHESTENDYANGLGFILETFRQYEHFLCIHAAYSTDSDQYSGHEIPLDLMCEPIKQNLGKSNLNGISVTKVCRSVSECSKDDGFWKSLAEKDVIANACKGTKCRVENAIPVMASLLWYKVSDFFANSLCYNYLSQADIKQAIADKRESIANMAYFIKQYISILTWDSFLEHAVVVGGYKELKIAMDLVKKHEKIFLSSIDACQKIDATLVCIIEDIYLEYQKLVRLARELKNPGQTRNMRENPWVNHAKLLDLRTKALNKIDILATLIRTKTVVEKDAQIVSDYFTQLSKFDENIARKDVLYLQDKLEEFQRKATPLVTEINGEIKKILTKAIAGSGVAAFINGLSLIEALNPLNLLDAFDTTYDAVKAIFQNIKGISKGAQLIISLQTVFTDTLTLEKDFKENNKNFSDMTNVLNILKSPGNLTLEQFKPFCNDFLKYYGAYTPQVDRSRLAKNDALWAKFKDEACELLGVGTSSRYKALVGVFEAARLSCETLDGSLAELSTLRANIFDFQFELVETFARVFRGVLGKAGVKKDFYRTQANDNKKSLFLGFLKTHNLVQDEAAAYCNRLEYMNQGQRLSVCKPWSGLFSKPDFDELVAYNPEVTYHLEERFVYIPITPQFHGDTGFIDLKRLASNNFVTFTPPANETWLRQFNWLTSGEAKAPFVESIKLYLPRKTFSHGLNLRTTVKMTSIGANRVDISSNTDYDLPLRHSHFYTTYSEGLRRCPIGKVIDNPYSLCGNLDKICDSTINVPGDTMMPTVLTTWKLEYETRERNNSNDLHTWDVPKPTTNLLVIGKAKLRYLPNAEITPLKRSVSPNQNRLGCCLANTYRPVWNDINCNDCPTGSYAKLDGYYCDRDAK